MKKIIFVARPRLKPFRKKKTKQGETSTSPEKPLKFSSRKKNTHTTKENFWNTTVGYPVQVLAAEV
jgi:hypothetical protein